MRHTNLQLVAIAALAAMAGRAASMGPDSFGYRATSDVAYSFQDLAATGTRVLAGGDDDSLSLNVGFSFAFYGTPYTAVCVSTNGLLTFGGCSSDFANVDLTSGVPAGNRPVIAPFWSDLTFTPPGADAIYYQTLGTAPNRRFVIQWNNAFPVGGAAGVTFQTVLYEAGGVILMQYRTVIAGAAAADKGSAATVGIRDASGNLNGRVLQWSFDAPVLANGAAIRFAPPAATGAVDVTTQFKVVTSGLVYNRTAGTYSGSVTLTNSGTTSIARPIQILFSGLTAGVSVVSPAGTNGAGPYLNAPGAGALGAGQSVVVPVVFLNPANAKILYKLIVYSGGL